MVSMLVLIQMELLIRIVFFLFVAHVNLMVVVVSILEQVLIQMVLVFFLLVLVLIQMELLIRIEVVF
jgi:hypothetical protein